MGISSVDFHVGRLWGKGDQALHLVPPDLIRAFAPATCCLYEWTDYWLKSPGADRLSVGGTWLVPVDAESGLFCVRFENQLGLAVVQPFAGQHPLCAPLHVEVISPKFHTPARHFAFLRTLLDDLFARAARLPFTISAPTGRSVTEAIRPPTPLFVLHFLCQYAPALKTAMVTIQAAPHRQLCDFSDFVPLAQATEADADVLISILHTPEQLAPARGFLLAKRLKGYAPVQVWQRRPEETFDTPENRFVLTFLQQVLAAAEELPSQSWWCNVPSERQLAVRQVATLLRQAIRYPMFDDVGPMHRFPASSQVLLRREGYRDMLALWQVFNHARRPLFEPLHKAMDVRDIATWEHL